MVVLIAALDKVYNLIKYMKIFIRNFNKVPGMFDPQIGMIHHKTRAVGARCYRVITGPRRQKKTSNAGKFIRNGKKIK